VSSSKGQLGHTLAGAGAIEAAIAALVVQRRTLVPTVGLDEPDSSLPLVHVPHRGREVARVRAAVSSAFGFGGMDTVLVLAHPHTQTARSRAAPSAPAVVITAATVFGACGVLGTEACADLGLRTFDPAVPVDPAPHLDAMRARRLDRGAQLGTVAVMRALQDAGGDPSGAGLVLGSAFGNVDGSAAFMHRIFEKGPRAASPADFPNMVPSSAVGHASIYLGLHGPAFATADLATSGESAFAQAVQLVRAGEAPRIVAGAFEPRGDIVERVLAALFPLGPERPALPRSDVAAAVVVESEDHAKARGARLVARVVQTLEWRGVRQDLGDIAAPPGDSPEVVLARSDEPVEALLAGSAWARARRHTCAHSVGESDALGAVALAMAVGRIAARRANGVLVVGLARDRGYAVVLAPA
jgi:3-oxoacyl-[acyl-carrier-protein] synthase II